MRPPTELALLPLLRVKQRLPILQPLYQLLDPIKRSLIGDAGCHALVMADLPLDLNALLAH
jgi:hypothetical protein